MSPAIIERTARHLRTTSTSAAAWEGQVIELRAGDPHPRAAPPDLPLGDTHQQPVQLCQRRVALWAGTGERRSHPADSGSSRAAAARVCPHPGVGRDHGHDATQMPGAAPHRQVPAVSRPVPRWHHPGRPPC